ncbi:MAG: CheB methylesterase domain-containing protein [Defluviitaleaceae bacterium]|nr:CheB methylesterase domain-containing protein [Defluviitaleaceae bacterium]MCL2837446.1 CheB methylesterase domain-containing protein [Defluviitaleaceae bacterium]
MNRINVVVLSGDFKFKTAISDTLRKDPGLIVDASCYNIDAAQSKFVKNNINVLIIDFEGQNYEQRFLKALTEKHMLYIITVGRRVPFMDSAIQFVMKPATPSIEASNATAAILLQKIKSMAVTAPTFTMRDITKQVDARHKLIAIASSTGGTEALPTLLSELPKEMPPILIVQHMPSMFTKQLADRIDKMCAMHVKEASNGEMVMKGTAYIAPGDLHMRMIVRQQKLALDCFHSEKVNGVRPAADILFDTVAHISGANAIGVILTGMGADGAKGLMEMHRKGSPVIAQDKESCVVYGMPRAAVELGVVNYQLPLKSIAKKLIELVL